LAAWNQERSSRSDHDPRPRDSWPVGVRATTKHSPPPVADLLTFQGVKKNGGFDFPLGAHYYLGGARVPPNYLRAFGSLCPPSTLRGKLSCCGSTDAIPWRLGSRHPEPSAGRWIRLSRSVGLSSPGVDSGRIVGWEVCSRGIPATENAMGGMLERVLIIPSIIET
jgi:hypothetical protein